MCRDFLQLRVPGWFNKFNSGPFFIGYRLCPCIACNSMFCDVSCSSIVVHLTEVKCQRLKANIFCSHSKYARQRRRWTGNSFVHNVSQTSLCDFCEKFFKTNSKMCCLHRDYNCQVFISKKAQLSNAHYLSIDILYA